MRSASYQTGIDCCTPIHPIRPDNLRRGRFRSLDYLDEDRGDLFTNCIDVVASDQGERGNLPNLAWITEGLLRSLRFALGPRNDTPTKVFARALYCKTALVQAMAGLTSVAAGLVQRLPRTP